MGILQTLGIISPDTIAKPIDAIGNTFDKIFTSDEERLQGQAVLEKLKLHGEELQVEMNKVEAQHRSIFIAGWRPAIGWTLAISLFTYYVPQFIVATALWVKLCYIAQGVVAYPISDISGLTQLVLGMLGLGTLRTVEKALKITK
jgi:hypothetical protein